MKPPPFLACNAFYVAPQKIFPRRFAACGKKPFYFF